MRLKLTEKSQVSVKLEYGKFRTENNRERSFITNCIKELKTKGTTICFSEWQLEELSKNLNIRYETKDKYFVVYLNEKEVHLDD